MVRVKRREMNGDEQGWRCTSQVKPCITSLSKGDVEDFNRICPCGDHTSLLCDYCGVKWYSTYDPGYLLPSTWYAIECHQAAVEGDDVN